MDLFESLPEPPDGASQAIACNACASLCNERAIQLGYRVIGDMPQIRKSNPSLVGSLLNMLMKFGQVDDAEHLFESLEKKTLAIYGTMMQGKP